MTVDAGALTYQFKADVSDIKAKVAEIQKSLQQAGQQAQQAGKQIAEGMKDGQKAMQDATIAGTTLGTTLGTVLGRGLGAAIKGAFGALQEFAGEIKDLQQTAKLTGLSLEQMFAIRRIDAKGGSDGFDMAKGMQEFAIKIREASREENDLYELLKKNGIEIKDSAGKVRPFKDILAEAANLVRDANNEIDKIQFAEKIGMGRDAVKFLEKYAENIRDGNVQVDAADEKLAAVKRQAEEFQREWAAAWSRWKDDALSAIASAFNGLNGLMGKAGLLGAGFYMGGALGPKGGTYYMGGADGQSTDEAGLVIDLKPSRRRFGTADRAAGDNNLRDKKTISFPDKGGGSSGKSSLDQIERYIAGLEKARDTAQVEVELWGKSNLDREKALKLVEAANAAKRAGRDLTEDEKQKIGEIVTKTVQWKDQLDQLRAVQDAMREFGNTLAGGLEQAIINGQKLGDVLKNVVKSLASSALKGLLTGEGPLGKIMGLSGQNGMAGGLFGSLFNGFKMFADGGRPPTGVPSIIGERGPELWMPDSAGTVIPAGKFSVGGGGGTTIHIDARGADAGVVTRIQQAMKAMDQNFNVRVAGVNRNQQLRGFTA